MATEKPNFTSDLKTDTADELMYDIESDVACKAGVQGDAHQTDLSSLQYNLKTTTTNQDKSETNELILDTNNARIIDRALGIYYKRLKKNNYYNNPNNPNQGLFLQYFETHNYELDEIEEELSQLPHDKNGAEAAKNCSYLEFTMFNNFPMYRRFTNVNDQRIEQLKILQHCLEFGVPPFQPQSMSKNILLIHGFVNEHKTLLVYPMIEQCIFLFYANTELYWQKRLIYKERLDKILTKWQDWNKMDTISCILPNFMWLGDEDCACDITTLEKLGISYILNCAGYDCQNVEYPKYFKEHVLFADDADDYNIIQCDVDECIQFISECIANKGKILIHCYAGMNRSATITIAALMYFKGMDLFQAIKYTQSRRGWILSNEAFQSQLIQYAADLDLLIE